MKQRHLQAAKSAKFDEYYTLRNDIDIELDHYKHHFQDQIIYCNCDSHRSNFARYFEDNYTDLRLGGLYYTSKPFDSPESMQVFNKADIIVTNPPFSLFRKFFLQTAEAGKKFILVAPYTSVQYNQIWPYIKSGYCWLGYNAIHNGLFDIPAAHARKLVQSGRGYRWYQGRVVARAHCTWITNLKHNKVMPKLDLTHTYKPETYPNYDNYPAIEVSRVAKIPADYKGLMGVPITYLVHHNPQQFELVDLVKVPVIGFRNLYARYIIRAV